MTTVSVVVPCHNPTRGLFDTIASVRAQTHRKIELVLVNDGTDSPGALPILRQASGMADRYEEQADWSLPAARNLGFSAAGGEFVLPMDAGDVILPKYVEDCLSALHQQQFAAFAYTRSELRGSARRVTFGTEYNLYHLLEENHITSTALVRKADWQCVGGYDESMRCGCEDWEFWLRLGANGRYGVLVPKTLFRHQDRRLSSDQSLQSQDEIVSYIRQKHPELYASESRMRIKAKWQPAVCISGPHEIQTIEDIEVVHDEFLRDRSRAGAFLLAGPEGAGPHAAEMAALAVWAGRTGVQFPDGSVALSRDGRINRGAAHSSSPRVSRSMALGWLRQHFVNAELNSWDAWLRHPARSLARLIPLRVKERINQLVRRPAFDLSFYLQFQPASVLVGNSVVLPLRYIPKFATRRRVAFVTPHLGPGGAESVLLEIAAALEPTSFELLVLATHSRDDRWASRWQAVAEHIYDLATIVPPHRMSAAIYSVVTNWRCEAVLVQNSLFGYASLPLVRRDAPSTRIMDLVHATSADWDQVAATAGVSGAIDTRIAISEKVRRRLLQAGVPDAQVRLVKNGVNLQRFRPDQQPRHSVKHTILFAGRLDDVKRPLILVDIADHLATLRTTRDFRIAVAGYGPKLPSLRVSARRRGVEDLFEFLGFVDEMATLFGQSDVLILPSREEGMPLVILEAMACGCPVVASKVGAIPEAVYPDCGILVETGEGEVSRFAAALDKLLSEDRSRIAMGNAGRKKAEAEFDSAFARKAYRQLFE